MKLYCAKPLSGQSKEWLRNLICSDYQCNKNYGVVVVLVVVPVVVVAGAPVVVVVVVVVAVASGVAVVVPVVVVVVSEVPPHAVKEATSAKLAAARAMV